MPKRTELFQVGVPIERLDVTLDVSESEFLHLRLNTDALVQLDWLTADGDTVASQPAEAEGGIAAVSERVRVQVPASDAGED